MTELTRPSSALPARVTGDPVRWFRDGAVVGAVTGYVAPAALIFGLTLHPWLVACTVAFALGGAALGGGLALGLDRARGRVSLRTLAVALPSAAFLLGGLWAASAAWLVGAPVLVAGVFGAVAAAVQVGLCWLPYTVGAALELPRWPVLLAAMALAPVVGELAKLVFLLL